MIAKKNAYNSEIPEIAELQKVSEKEITELMGKYLESYRDSFVRSQQIKYFEAFEKGLLSDLSRKSIEPIALSFLGESEVRGMQQFFTRSKGWEESVKQRYKEKLGEAISGEEGFLSVDESDFEKKGKESAGVARQYCGRLGKKENCQAGVYVSYASESGIGLIESKLYLPEAWFGDDYEERRKDCQIPDDVTFQSKNAMAKEMINDVMKSRLFTIKYIGCDASFGSDHTFLDSLPESVYYFASVRENEYIFRTMPRVVTPENAPGRGGRFKHPRSAEEPIAIKTILDDESVPWVKRIISTGTKGPISAEVKCLRCVSSRKVNRLFMPKAEIWVYIRKHDDGTIKYFICNLPEDADISLLDKLATARWSIEQCFQECKSYLGMAHYEARSYQAWHRHMLFVMIAHLFIIILRIFLKKICCSHYAHGSFHHCFADFDSHKPKAGFNDCSLSFAS